MNTNVLIVIAVIVLVAIGGFFFFTAEDAQAPEEHMQEEKMEQEDTMMDDAAMKDEKNTESIATITYTDDGYVPNTVVIDRGGTVVFNNESSDMMWPATAMHPTHTVYPGSDIAKCDTALRGELFDSCGGISSGASWSFTFNEVGEWKFHDHLNPRDNGTIIVQ